MSTASEDSSFHSPCRSSMHEVRPGSRCHAYDGAIFRAVPLTKTLLFETVRYIVHMGVNRYTDRSLIWSPGVSPRLWVPNRSDESTEIRFCCVITCAVLDYVQHDKDP